jgi:hypothetical protein
MIKDKTLKQIHREGWAALKKKLGRAGLVRFLQQFENGSGDSAAWLAGLANGITRGGG